MNWNMEELVSCCILRRRNKLLRGLEVKGDGNSFTFQIFFHSLGTQVSSLPRLLESSERCLRKMLKMRKMLKLRKKLKMRKMLKMRKRFLSHMGDGVVVAVDPDASSLHPLRELERRLQVLGQDPCRQPIAGCIRSLNSLNRYFPSTLPVALFYLLQVGELEDALHRAKDLLLGDAHVVGHSRENRRLDEEASISLTAATGLQGGPLPLAGLDEAKDLVPLDAVNLRALIHSSLPRVPDNPGLRQGGGSFDELVVDSRLHQSSASRATVLAVVGKKCVVGDLNLLMEFSLKEVFKRRETARFQEKKLKSRKAQNN